ncbi:SdpI family protein [Aurantiacibacter gangjinensis]|uniref:Membrane protein n=1 Tax=Aurantiacibacter gangjinensis TaxID=502682 RepID=A0A0G9MVW1_9SPHN|nr:SdpI family protein [Aurantiacibacter gangjinensis]APE26968.1 hypothetical protein BMF35_a0139 [Aurantiacibacter gangjinensis]KLE33418.1 membrane protein [Aurantiacibacter gangjinensis]
MNVRVPLMISLAIMAAMTVFAFVTEARIPDGTQLPIHWNAAGEPDNFAPALTALLLPVGVLALTSLLFAIIPTMEPLQDRLEGSAPVLRATWIGMMLLCIVIQAVVGLPAWGVEIGVNAIIVGTGLLLVILGNVLPKSRPGFFVGIRTPWAILDTDNWIATHRLGGKLFMAAGLLIIIAALLPLDPALLAPIVLASVLGAGLVPFAYSWWLWHSRTRA